MSTWRRPRISTARLVLASSCLTLPAGGSFAEFFVGTLAGAPLGGHRLTAEPGADVYFNSSLLAESIQIPEEGACYIAAAVPLKTKREIADRNCLKVRLGVETYIRLYRQGGVSKFQFEDWIEDASKALSLCEQYNQSLHTNKTEEGTHKAVNAWGTYMMRSKECCTLNRAPYCIEKVWTNVTIAVMATAASVAILFFAAGFASFYKPHMHFEDVKKSLEEDQAPVPDLAPQGYRESGDATQKLSAELENAWLTGSSLRVLPYSQEFARATAVIFAALQERFDFQVDSVKCQHEHLMSMWRSTVSTVADRYIENCENVKESSLLKDALQDLSRDMLEGFRGWRTKVRREQEAFEQDSAGETADEMGPPMLAGARYASIAGFAQELSSELAELCTFLLVWGEAGNIRFMPEVLYFITHLALTADDRRSCSALYGGAPRWPAEANGPYRSGLFLSKIIRPIYNHVFSEWYSHMEGVKDEKDKKVLKPGYENFLPPDVANYDDWDELFCDPARMAQKLVLFDGSLLYELKPGERFAATPLIDWARSFCQTKTHREVHSLWGVFASTHRIVLLHMLMFFTGIVLMAGPPPRFPRQRDSHRRRGLRHPLGSCGPRWSLSRVHMVVRSL